MPGIFESLKKTPLATLNERLSDLAGFFFEISRMKASQVAAQQALQGLQQLGQGVEGPAGEYIRGVAQSLMPLGAVPGVDPTKIAGVYETLAQIKYNEAVNQITKQAVQETLSKLTDVYNKMTETTLKSIKETPTPKTGIKEIDDIFLLGQKAIMEGINAQLNLAKVQLEGLKELAQKPNIKLDYSMVDKALGVLEGLSNVLSKYASPEAQVYRAGIAAQIASQRLAMQQQKEAEKDRQKITNERLKLEREIIENSTQIANNLGIKLEPNEAVVGVRLSEDKTNVEVDIYNLMTGKIYPKRVEIGSIASLKLLEKPEQGLYSKQVGKITSSIRQLQLLLESPTFEDYQKSLDKNKGIIQLPQGPQEPTKKDEKIGFGAFSPVLGAEEKKEEPKKQELPEWAKPTKKQIPGIGRFTF
jgi:hypothetical protein